MMELSKLSKLLRSCEVFNTRITANMVELQFAKVKSQTEKRIDYSQMLDLLANLATILYLEADPSHIGRYRESPANEWLLRRV